MRRSGHTAPLVATLHMLWRRWARREEVCWWGYADDVAGAPVLRPEPCSPALVIRRADGLLSHGVQLQAPDLLVRLEFRLRVAWEGAWRRTCRLIRELRHG
jgi:hypothetical protein